MSAPDYYARRRRRDASKDPTLSMQLGVGFEPRALLANYLNDPRLDNYSVCSCSAPTRTCPAPRAKQAMSYIRLNTDIPGPRAQRSARPPRGRGAGWTRPRDRRGRRARRRRAGLRRRRQHVHRFRRRHRHAGRRPRAAGGREGDRRTGRSSTFSRARWSRPMSRTSRLAELLNELTPGDVPEEDDPRQQRRRSGRERGQAVAQVHRPPGGHLLRRRLSRPDAAHAEPDQQVRAVQERLRSVRAGDRPSADSACSIARPTAMTEDEYVDFGIRQLEHALVAQVDPKAVAAVIIEPVQGEAGFMPVPPRFLARIRELCTQHGIVMIADEVQCGMGRTGRLFAVEHYGIVPDLDHDREVARRRHADRRRHRPRGDPRCRASRRRRRHLRRQPGRVRRGDRGASTSSGSRRFSRTRGGSAT